MKRDLSEALCFNVFCNCCDNLIFCTESEREAREEVKEAREKGMDVCLFASFPDAEVEVLS